MEPWESREHNQDEELASCSKFLNSKTVNAIYPGTSASLWAITLKCRGSSRQRSCASISRRHLERDYRAKDYLLRIALTGPTVLFYSNVEGMSGSELIWAKQLDTWTEKTQSFERRGEAGITRHGLNGEFRKTRDLPLQGPQIAGRSDVSSTTLLNGFESKVQGTKPSEYTYKHYIRGTLSINCKHSERELYFKNHPHPFNPKHKVGFGGTFAEKVWYRELTWGCPFFWKVTWIWINTQQLI
jgi:hypothetical protein